MYGAERLFVPPSCGNIWSECFMANTGDASKSKELRDAPDTNGRLPVRKDSVRNRGQAPVHVPVLLWQVPRGVRGIVRDEHHCRCCAVQDHGRQGKPHGLRVKSAEIPPFLLWLRLADLQPRGEDAARRLGPLRYAKPRIRACALPIMRSLLRRRPGPRSATINRSLPSGPIRWWLSSISMQPVGKVQPKGVGGEMFL